MNKGEPLQKHFLYLYSKQSQWNYPLFTVKALPTNVVQYQSLTETHNQKFAAINRLNPLSKVFDGELFRKGTYLTSGTILTGKYSYRHYFFCDCVKLWTKISLLLKQIEDLGSWWPSTRKGIGWWGRGEGVAPWSTLEWNN